MGDLPKALDLAMEALKATEGVTVERMEVDLVRDLGGKLIGQYLSAGAYANISALLKTLGGLPAASAARLLNVQGMRAGAVAVALHEKDPDQAIKLLADREYRRGWAVSTGELMPLWKAAWQLKVKNRMPATSVSRARFHVHVDLLLCLISCLGLMLSAELGRDLTPLEQIKTRRDHPPPASIFFGGAT